MSRGGIVAVALLAAIAASFGHCQVRRTQLDTAFGKVVSGDAERDVVAKMGRPHRVVEGCGYYYSKPIDGCAREYVYFPPWTIIDEAWLIAFDPSGAVYKTAYFVSP